ncbi:MAG: hypothetical protein WC307_03150 [Candidatus Nanoarchaeia archaeon]|jgi:hypothetical protein
MTPDSSNIKELAAKRDELNNKFISKTGRVMAGLSAIPTLYNVKADSELERSIIDNGVQTNPDFDWSQYNGEGEAASMSGLRVDPLVHSVLQSGVYGLAAYNALKGFKEAFSAKTIKGKIKGLGKAAGHVSIALLSDYLAHKYGQSNIIETFSGITIGSREYSSYGPAAGISASALGLEALLTIADEISLKRTHKKINKLNQEINTAYENILQGFNTSTKEDIDYMNLGEAIIAKYPKIKKEKAIMAVSNKFMTEWEDSYKGTKFNKKYTELAEEIYNEFTSAGLEKPQVLDLIKKIKDYKG